MPRLTRMMTRKAPGSEVKGPRTTAESLSPSEKHVENFIRIEFSIVRAATHSGTRGEGGTFRPIPVVLLPLFRVRQHGKGVRDLFEILFSKLFAFEILVRVPLQSQLAVTATGRAKK